MMKKKRLAMSQETFSSYSSNIAAQIIAHPMIQKAKIIGCYVSLPGEVETQQLISQLLLTHRICVPKVHQDTMDFYEIHSLSDLKKGHFHVLEPVSDHYIAPSDIDCMITPLLAYDQDHYRVGYGKGYYDKYFAGDFHGYKIGLAFSYQYVDHIDIDQYDHCLDEIIHEI